MIQLDYMEMDGRLVTRDFDDLRYRPALEMFHARVRNSQEYHLVYLWLCDDDKMIDDRVILERWVRI